MIGDVDYFKQYNDLYGHQQGDECLKKIAALWKDICKRPSDLAARIGGEEFAIIVPDMQPDKIVNNLQDFMAILHKQPIPHSTSPVAPHVTMSIGVAGIIPHKDTSSKALFALADRRLYAAKKKGRNCLVAK